MRPSRSRPSYAGCGPVTTSTEAEHAGTGRRQRDAPPAVAAAAGSERPATEEATSRPSPADAPDPPHALSRDVCHAGRSGKTRSVFAVLIAILSLALIPLLVVAATRLTTWAQFRSALGPGVPDRVPDAWVREIEPPGAS